MPWMNRGIALGAPTAESEMLRLSHCGYNRNGHVHFVFLTGSIQKAPVGSCSLRGGTKPPSSAQDLSRVGWHCKGQRRAATTTPLPPQHLWVPPKTQPSCPTAAGEVSSPAFSPPGTQNDHLIPRLRLFGILQGSWRWGWRQDLLPRSAGFPEGSREEPAGSSGLEMARSSRKEKVKRWDSPPTPRRVGSVVTQTTRKERSAHSELSLHNFRINSVNKAVA